MAKKLDNLKSVLAAGKKNDEKEDKKGEKVMSKSKAAKEAHEGKDMGKKNIKGKTGFDTVASKAAKEYVSEEAGEKVAGAVFQKMRKAKEL